MIFSLNSSANRRTSSANSRFAGLFSGKISPVKSRIFQCFEYNDKGLVFCVIFLYQAGSEAASYVRMLCKNAAGVDL